ncbi:MAG TPA: hypothetical protein VEX13_06025 [Chloroflexia bacterium]|nr:hypothetical protein [Chloroflexia bacterium]
MMLVIVAVCGVTAMLILRPPQDDALAELRALPLYPGVSSFSFSDNTRFQEAEARSWNTKNGGIGSDRYRNLNVTKASMTFATDDEPGSVMEFYNDQVPRRGYWAVGSKPPGYRYLRWVAPFEMISDFSGLILGDELDHPITFYEVNVSAVEAQPDYDAKSRTTQVTVELIILSESHELK